MIDKIISEAFELYMPQVKSEITDLANLIQNDIFDKRENDPFYQYNILEIGTKNGGTFYIWNKLNELTNGMNISIDMSDGGIHGGIEDEKMDKRDLWFLERFNNCHFIRGDSHEEETADEMMSSLYQEEFKESRSRLDPHSPLDIPEIHLYAKLDFLFIDGDHTYEGVKKDFEDYSPFVKPGGLVVFHDIIISEHHHSRNVYVGEFWNELKSSGKYETIEFIGDPEQNWAGIGILVKR